MSDTKLEKAESVSDGVETIDSSSNVHAEGVNKAYEAKSNLSESCLLSKDLLDLTTLLRLHSQPLSSGRNWVWTVPNRLIPALRIGMDG